MVCSGLCVVSGVWWAVCREWCGLVCNGRCMESGVWRVACNGRCVEGCVCRVMCSGWCGRVVFSNHLINVCGLEGKLNMKLERVYHFTSS